MNTDNLCRYRYLPYQVDIKTELKDCGKRSVFTAFSVHCEFWLSMKKLVYIITALWLMRRSWVHTFWIFITSFWSWLYLILFNPFTFKTISNAKTIVKILIWNFDTQEKCQWLSTALSLRLIKIDVQLANSNPTDHSWYLCHLRRKFLINQKHKILG